MQLLDYVSESLKDFLLEKNISLEKKHPLAFTFSFPCEHFALDQVMTPFILSWFAPAVSSTLYICSHDSVILDLFL